MNYQDLVNRGKNASEKKEVVIVKNNIDDLKSNLKVVKEFVKEPDDEIEEIAIVTEKKALELLTYEEDKKILKYVFNR